MIINPRRILWPTDFSPLSLKAAEYVNGFRNIFEAEVHVIHVCQPIAPTAVAVPFTGGIPVDVPRAELLSSANAHLNRLCNEVFHGDKKVTFEALTGNPWVEVCRYAERTRIDLIIVATHGLTGLKRVLLGSVAERIVQHAPCPVLVVKSVERGFAEA